MHTPSTYRANEPLVTFLERCRAMRRTATSAEALLWPFLRDRQLAGAKFRRQHQYGPYVLDFFCAERRLAIEVDGDTHGEADQMTRDAARTRYLVTNGIREMRFTNREVLNETAAAVESIWRAVERPSPSP